MSMKKKTGISSAVCSCQRPESTVNHMTLQTKISYCFTVCFQYFFTEDFLEIYIDTEM